MFDVTLCKQKMFYKTKRSAMKLTDKEANVILASHADVHAFLPHERLLTWREKKEKFRAWLHSSRKGQKGLMKGEDLTVLKQTTQLTHKRSY